MSKRADRLRRVHEMPLNACIAKRIRLGHDPIRELWCDPFDLDDLVRTVGQYARPTGAAL